MLLALGVCAVVAAVLASQVAMPVVRERLAALRERIAARARELLRSCVNDEEWEMYRDLGFLRVWGAFGAGTGDGAGVAPYAYLISPHKPIVAYVPQTSRLLNEYCVEFPDHERPHGSSRLPPSDDVLAKWLGLTGDERSLIASSNLHLAGRQLDPDVVRADLAALRRWERGRIEQVHGDAGSVPAP